jgi:hypothetical protein
MRTFERRIPRGRRRAAERGVALILVMLFLGLMILLGLAATMTSITEVNVSGNLRLQTEAFDTADAGAAHAFELVRHMNGDFTALLQGPDNTLKTGDEFSNVTNSGTTNWARTFNTNGTVATTSSTTAMFDDTKAVPIPNTNGRSLVRIDGRHFYELVAYDDAADTKSYMADASLESSQDPPSHSGPGNPAVDFDQRVLIRSIGYVIPSDVANLASFTPANSIASSVVDIIVGLTPYPAVISNDDLDLTNSIAVSGAFGSVHANNDLLLGSGNFTVSQSATFSNVDGVVPSGGWDPTADDSHVVGYNGPAGQVYIPDLNPFDYAKDCDYICISKATSSSLRQTLVNRMNSALTGSGDAFKVACDAATSNAYLTYSGNIFVKKTGPTSFTVTTDASNNASYSDSGLSVSMANNSNSAGSLDAAPAAGSGKSVFFLLAPGGDTVKINGNLNGQTTVITNGNVLLNGNSKLKPQLSITPHELPPWDHVDTLVLAGEDLQMLGNASGTDLIEGLLYAHEQFDMSGSGNVSGQVIGYEHALAYDSVANTVSTNSAFSSAASTPIGVHGSILHGNFEITHDISRGYLGSFSIVSWRQLHDFDPVTAAR